MGLTAVLTVLFDFAFEPFASRVKHYWLWTPTKFPVTWQGVPLVEFPGLGWPCHCSSWLFIAPAFDQQTTAVKDIHRIFIRLPFGSARFYFSASPVRSMELWPAAIVNGIIAWTAVRGGVFAIRGGTW